MLFNVIVLFLIGKVYCSLNGKNCSTLWLNGISLAVFGIGGAMFCVPALADMNDSAL